MTLHDPIQGFLLSSPEILFCANKPRPLRTTQSRRTDRLQGIFFAPVNVGRSTQTSLGSNLKDLPELMAASSRSIDDLSIREMEDDEDELLSAAWQTPAVIVRNPRHKLVDTFLQRTR